MLSGGSKGYIGKEWVTLHHRSWCLRVSWIRLWFKLSGECWSSYVLEPTVLISVSYSAYLQIASKFYSILIASQRIVWLCILLFSEKYATKVAYPANTYLFKVNNRNTRKRYEIWTKLTIKISERHQWRRSGVFVNFEHVSQLFLMFLLLNLNK